MHCIGGRGEGEPAHVRLLYLAGRRGSGGGRWEKGHSSGFLAKGEEGGALGMHKTGGGGLKFGATSPRTRRDRPKKKYYSLGFWPPQLAWSLLSLCVPGNFGDANLFLTRCWVVFFSKDVVINVHGEEEEVTAV